MGIFHLPIWFVKKINIVFGFYSKTCGYHGLKRRRLRGYCDIWLTRIVFHYIWPMFIVFPYIWPTHTLSNNIGSVNPSKLIDQLKCVTRYFALANQSSFIEFIRLKLIDYWHIYNLDNILTSYIYNIVTNLCHLIPNIRREG